MNTTTNNSFGALVRAGRNKLDITQQQLADMVGRSRKWMVQVEKGERYDTSEDMRIDPDMVVKIALILDIDPVEALYAVGAPKDTWPDFSHLRLASDNVRVVDITSLTPEQTKLVEGMIDEFRKLNRKVEQ
ncbi:helix-turn-helix domain-containing protein [Corynebacterium vitaeruminis]|uniref:HTH cro/C1-type domain-containing protein n=1 Tax=Corynebacterium vitaeruminis DSM 20294 TaxID=1224164 RepID=W5Y3H3_9CORY|nr:helix-turn-helix transcriptional regulator [Corynebacterium vitaeruminis]AHI23385.1 hypothetical protein B843_10000 [Corynebacterium vitaeruminis DSM 20294]